MPKATSLITGALAAATSLLLAAAPQAFPYRRPIVAVNPNQSNNWSGYNQGALEKGVQFHQVSGTWAVPTATRHKAGENEYSSTWVGIGGGCVDAGCTVGDTTLIQAGTEQDVDRSGRAAYSAGGGVIPRPPVGVNMTVAAGGPIDARSARGAPGGHTGGGTPPARP